MRDKDRIVFNFIDDQNQLPLASAGGSGKYFTFLGLQPL
jgi:hypothetical protein